MPRRARKAAPDPNPEVPVTESKPEDDFVSSLKSDLVRTQQAAGAKTGEDLTHRAKLNQRLLQDLWEVHNQFEEIGVHLAIDPSQTLFATFVEYPTTWTFRDNFDFGAVKTIELGDRASGWVGFTLRSWYLSNPRGQDPPPLDLRVVRRGELPPLLRMDADDEPGRALRRRRGRGRGQGAPPDTSGTWSCSGTRRTSRRPPRSSSRTSKRSIRRGRRTRRNRTAEPANPVRAQALK